MMTPDEVNVSLFDECKRLQGEIADLKRQLAERDAPSKSAIELAEKIDDFTREELTGKYEVWAAGVAKLIDAYVQEKVAEALLDFTISALDYFSKKSTTGQQGERGIYARTYQKFGEFVNSEHPKLSANRNKVIS